MNLQMPRRNAYAPTGFVILHKRKSHKSMKEAMKYSIFQYKKNAHEIDLERYRTYRGGKIVKTEDGNSETVPSDASLWERRDLMNHVADINVRPGASFEDIYEATQHGSNPWTERDFVTEVKNPATSLSVGDVIWNRETGEAFIVRKVGFDRIDVL